MNSEMMAKLRGLIVEAASGTCKMTAEGTFCPVHENEKCPGYVEEKEDLDEAFDATATLKRVRGAAKKAELGNDTNAAKEFASQIDTDLTDLFQWYDSKQQTENKEKIRSLIKANKAAEQNANLKHANTVAEVLLDVMRSSGAVSENIKPAGISDELAAKKIAAKIAGTPGLNMPKIKQYVTKYLSMVGKASTDVTHLAALVSTELENKGVMESNAKPDFRDLDGDGNKKEPMKDAAKDAKADKKPAAKKGGMSAKQAKYFGKKTVKESAELQALMQKYGVDETVVDEHFFFPDTRSREEKNQDANKPADILSVRNPGDVAKYGNEYKYMQKGTSPDAKRMKSKFSAGGPKNALPEDDGSNFSPELQALMQKYGVDAGNSAASVDTDSVDEDVHVTVDGQEAQDMISRLMSLAGQDTAMPADDHAVAAPMAYDHTGTCDGCGCASADCTCNSDITTGYSGPVDLSMEENIDHDFGHTAHSDMGEPVDPDTYTYKAPVGDQRMVKGLMGDNPLIKENAAALGAKLKKDYRRYVAEAELARSNAGDASPLTKDNREKFDIDPFVGDAPVTDGSRSPLSTIKRQMINK